MSFDLPQLSATAVGPAPDWQQDPAAAFMMKLDAHSPPPVHTVIMIVLNVIMFIAMFASGVNVEHPTTQSLLHWGANYGPRTSSAAEWWRLVSSMFLHANVFHIAFNMFVLWKIGSFIETLIGHRGFLIAYFASGVAGGFVSLLSHPYISSVGASGAIFGLYGVLIAILWRRDDAIPIEVLSPLTKSTLLFVGYNLVFGIINSGTDLAAHIGGLLAGFVCGVALNRPLTFEEPAPRGIRHAAIAATAALVFVAAALASPRYVDMLSELNSFTAIERSALTAYSAALHEARTHSLSDEQLADRIEHGVLPPWNAERARLARLQVLPKKQQQVIALVEKYMDERLQAWTTMVGGLRRHDRAAVMRGSAQQLQAIEVLKQLQALPH